VEAVLRRRPPQFHEKPLILPIMLDDLEKGKSFCYSLENDNGKVSFEDLFL
jgi:hypothetical protein